VLSINSNWERVEASTAVERTTAADLTAAPPNRFWPPAPPFGAPAAATASSRHAQPSLQPPVPRGHGLTDSGESLRADATPISGRAYTMHRQY
jgi:hypothetical protein